MQAIQIKKLEIQINVDQPYQFGSYGVFFGENSFRIRTKASVGLVSVSSEENERKKGFLALHRYLICARLHKSALLIWLDLLALQVTPFLVRILM